MIWNVEWYIAAILSAVVCLLGAVLHIIVPPLDANWNSVARRCAAAFIVGFIVFFVGVDPRNLTFPSGEAFAWVGGLVTTGYVAIDVLRQWTVVPATPVKGEAITEEE